MCRLRSFSDGGPTPGGLAIAIGLSVCLHLAILLPRSSASHRLPGWAFPAVIAHTAGKPLAVVAKGRSQSAEDAIPRSFPSAVRPLAEISPSFARDDETATPSKLLYLSDELEQQPSPVEEISVEPEEGFPAHVFGRAELSLLISETGQVRWIGVDYSDFDLEIIQQISDNFMRASFVPGQVKQQPVAALIKVQVDVARKKTL